MARSLRALVGGQLALYMLFEALLRPTLTVWIKAIRFFFRLLLFYRYQKRIGL